MRERHHRNIQKVELMKAMEDINICIASKYYNDAIKLMAQTELEETSTTVIGLYFYTLYLACYLLNNDLSNAKYLWKRSPDHIKDSASGSMMSDLWEVAKFLWVDNISAAITTLNKTVWPAELRLVADDLKNVIVLKHLETVGNTYVHITITHLANQLNISENDIEKHITYLGWHVDADSGTLVTVNAGNGTKTTAAVPEDIKDNLEWVHKATAVASHLSQLPIKTAAVKK